jgi:hypothetical protein
MVTICLRMIRRQTHACKTCKKTKTKLHGLSPQANYTDRLSDCRLSAKLVPTLADRGCRVVSATIPPQWRHAKGYQKYMNNLSAEIQYNSATQNKADQ